MENSSSKRHSSPRRKLSRSRSRSFSDRSSRSPSPRKSNYHSSRRGRDRYSRDDSGRYGSNSNYRNNYSGGRSFKDKHRNKGLKPGQEFAPFTRQGSTSSDEEAVPTPEERDACTVFVWQLASKVRPRDLEKFFSPIGRVRDVRLIMDSKTQRSKGIAYVEFFSQDSVYKGVRLSGTKLMGAPIQIQLSLAEKNRAAALAASDFPAISDDLPMKLYVGSLHYNINEAMLRTIFDPFGKIDDIKLIRDPVTNQSHGYGFVHFAKGRDAKKAMEQLNGFELVGRPLKVNYVLDRTENVNDYSLDADDADRTGLNLGSTGRLALMAKLAEGTGLTLPKATRNALAMSQIHLGATAPSTSNPVVPTACVLLSNMFDTRDNPAYEEIAEDVKEECARLGGVVHLYVDRSPSSHGNVYVKLANIATAAMCVNKLNGRFFSGRVISAEFYSVADYNRLFPDSVYKLS